MKRLILLLILLRVTITAGMSFYVNAFQVEDKNASFRRIKRSELQKYDIKEDFSIADEIEKVKLDLKQSKLDNVTFENMRGRLIHFSRFVNPNLNRSKKDDKMEEDLKRVSIFLYTARNPLKSQELLADDKDTLRNSNFKAEIPTKIIIHGYQNNGKSLVCLRLRDAYLAIYDYNVIVVDWGAIAESIDYILVAAYTKRVENVKEFITFLKDNGVEAKNIHIIEYDLGAHIAGGSQGNVDSKVGRITGLDSARNGFALGLVGRLTKTDADFVDVIHTN